MAPPTRFLRVVFRKDTRPGRGKGISQDLQAVASRFEAFVAATSRAAEVTVPWLDG